MENSPFSKLPDEVLMQILDNIQPDPERTVPIHHRAFLSVESFDVPPPSTADGHIRNFRRVCRKFADLGEPILFAMVAIRFSDKGLRKLEELLEWDNDIGKHVKKFSYLVPFYYPNARDILSTEVEDGTQESTRRLLQERMYEQQRILKAHHDIRALQKAMKSFKSLQFVKLLQVADRTDLEFQEYVRRQEGIDDRRDWFKKYWAPSCEHGSRALGQALEQALLNVHLSRFYIPKLNVHSLSSLGQSLSKELSILAERLTCLTLVFDDVDNLDERIQNLSSLFREVFTATKNMQAIHVGFLTTSPLTQPLEDVFHNVTWNNLLAFGVEGWRLDEQEIIDLATRHNRTLRGLRLRDIFLNEGSRWSNVLQSLKTQNNLEWLSLRRIGYEPTMWMNGRGAEVPDDGPEFDRSTDESSEDGYDDHETNGAGPSYSGQTNGQTNGHAVDAGDFDGYDSSDDDEQHGPSANSTEFPRHITRQRVESMPGDADRPFNAAEERPTNGASQHITHEEQQMESSLDEDLQDNGAEVSYVKRKAWEKWALNPRRRY